MRFRNLELVLLLAAAAVVLCLGRHTVEEKLRSSSAARPGPAGAVAPQKAVSPNQCTLMEDSRESLAAPLKAIFGAGSDKAVSRVMEARERSRWWSARNLSVKDLLGEPTAAQAPPSAPQREVGALRYGGVQVRSAETARRDWWVHMWVMVAGFFAAHLVFRLGRLTGGQAVLPTLLALTGLSACVLYVFRDPLREGPLSFPFFEGVIAGLAAAAVTGRFLRLDDLNRYRYLIMAAALGLSLLLVVFGTGPAGTDTRINLFGFQPVEFVKLLIVVFLAGYLADRRQELRHLEGVRIGPFSLPRLRDVLPVAACFASALSLFFLQRDMGPALVLYLVFTALFAAASRRFSLGFAGLLLLVGTFWYAAQSGSLLTVTTRIEMWLSPWSNHRPGGVHLAESVWAMASGGLAGSGPALATPRMIPAGHTDLILASAGEVFGLPGALGAISLLALLVGLISVRSYRLRDSFCGYLGLGLSLLVGVQAAVLCAGVTGLLPLTGIPLPFMGFGKSATIANFALAGLFINLSRGASSRAEDPVRSGPLFPPFVPAAVGICLLACALDAVRIMVVDSDSLMARPALTPQADGVRRYSVNRRLLELADRVPRGVIRDRNGIPLAISPSSWAEKEAALLEEGGWAPGVAPGKRFYPLGPAAVQVIGSFGGYWTDPRTLERSEDERLRGYPLPQAVEVVDGYRVLRPDYSALVGPFRDRGLAPQAGRLRDLLSKSRDVTVSLDARFQQAAYDSLKNAMPVVGGVRRAAGAAVVLDAVTGGVLACVSLPGYDPNIEPTGAELRQIIGEGSKSAFDRARFEVYPPGSTFKVVTAMAALESGWGEPGGAGGETVCRHVNEIPWVYGGREHRRRVTDDDSEGAHGTIGIERALVESCNVFFAFAGTRIGAQPLFDMAKGRLGLALKDVPSSADMEPNLPDNAYGQALVTAAPIEMAAVAACVANGGSRVEPRFKDPPEGQGPKPPMPVFKRGETAAKLQKWMVSVVRAGTGRRAAVPGVVVGGKTGTAQTMAGDRRSHAWFIGFARPESEPSAHFVAFAFLVENGGYGGRVAGQAAHDFLARVYPPPTDEGKNKKRKP